MASSGTSPISLHVFSCNEELYISKELNKNVLASEGKSHQPETMTTIFPQKNQYSCHDLSVLNEWENQEFCSVKTYAPGPSCLNDG